MRIRRQSFFCLFQHGYRLVVGDGREIIQEFCQWATGLQVVDQGLHGDASADEDCGTTENARIAVNDSPFPHDEHLQGSCLP